MKHVLDGVHIGETWRIRLNRPCAATMRPYVKLLSPPVKIRERADRQTDRHTDTLIATLRTPSGAK